MAKTKGTAGRRPRKRQPIGPPPKKPTAPPEQGVNLRYGSGGSGEISQKEADQLVIYPDAKEGESTPISERVLRPKSGKYKPIYDETVERIDKVHNYPAKSAPVILKTKKLGDGVMGNFSPRVVAKTNPDGSLGFQDVGKVNIDAKKYGDNEGGIRSTGTHEIGHDIDRYIQDAPKRATGKDRTRTEKFNAAIDEDYNSQQAFNALDKMPRTRKEAQAVKIAHEDDAYVKWAKTVVKTEAYWKIQDAKKARARGEDRQRYTYYTDPKTGEESKRTRYIPSEKHLNYLSSPVELFARGYAQYIATKTEDTGSLNHLMKEAKKPQKNPKIKTRFDALRHEWDKDAYDYERGKQWSKKDFGPLSDAYDDIFREAGLLHE